MGEYYLSLDVETGGPCPGIHPMLQLGAVAFDSNGKELGAFTANLKQGSYSWNPSTRTWWNEQVTRNPELEDLVFKNQRKIIEVMRDFEYFVIEMGLRTDSKVVPMAWPAGFDFPFVKYYMHKYRESEKLGIGCLCLKTYAMATLNKMYRETSKRTLPKGFTEDIGSHTHNALDDAREQGDLFFKLREYNKGRV